VIQHGLNRHRGKGQQKVIVAHLHVQSGGQSVVGMVGAPRGRGQPEIVGSTPCKANRPCTSAADAEPGQSKGAGTSRPRCRTTGVSRNEQPTLRALLRNPASKIPKATRKTCETRVWPLRQHRSRRTASTRRPAACDQAVAPAPRPASRAASIRTTPARPTSAFAAPSRRRSRICTFTPSFSETTISPRALQS
jgi:hypothetical protein